MSTCWPLLSLYLGVLGLTPDSDRLPLPDGQERVLKKVQLEAALGFLRISSRLGLVSQRS